jgi:drug/metabolite transporter (DMT)-like permease
MSSVQRNDAWIRAMPVVFVLIWSTGFIVARYGMPHAPPMKFLVLRYFLSVLCFAVWARWARAAWPVGRVQWAHLAVTGVLMHAGYLGGVWSAVKFGMGAGLVALLVGLQPVLTAVWVAGQGGQISARQRLGLGIGFIGLLLVVWQKLGLGEIHGLNFAMALVALVSMTAGTLYQKRFVQPCDVRTASLVQLTAAFVVTLPLALIETEAMHWHIELGGALAWSVFGLSLGGSSLLYLMIQRGAATAVSSLMYLVPPCTAVLAWLLFSEVMTVSAMAGLVLAAMGVSLVVRSPKTSSA